MSKAEVSESGSLRSGSGGEFTGDCPVCPAIPLFLADPR